MIGCALLRVRGVERGRMQAQERWEGSSERCEIEKETRESERCDKRRLSEGNRAISGERDFLAA